MAAAYLLTRRATPLTAGATCSDRCLHEHLLLRVRARGCAAVHAAEVSDDEISQQQPHMTHPSAKISRALCRAPLSLDQRPRKDKRTRTLAQKSSSRHSARSAPVHSDRSEIQRSRLLNVLAQLVENLRHDLELEHPTADSASIEQKAALTAFDGSRHRSREAE